ncbi:hypothetical protein VB005_04679 [Metarhizium brunneum]
MVLALPVSIPGALCAARCAESARDEPGAGHRGGWFRPDPCTHRRGRFEAETTTPRAAEEGGRALPTYRVRVIRNQITLAYPGESFRVCVGVGVLGGGPWDRGASADGIIFGTWD